MPRYQVHVDEVRQIHRSYIVEAENAGSARELAATGETITEVDAGKYVVVERHVIDTPALIPQHTYEIEQYELHTMKYRVEAGSEAEAIQNLLEGEGETVEETQEFIEVADRYGLPVTEHAELCTELRALGVKGLTDVIPSIRDIEEVDVNDDVSSSAEGISPALVADSAGRLFCIEVPPIAASPTCAASPAWSQLVRARSPGEAAEIVMELWNETCSKPPDGSVFVVSPLDEPEGVIGVVLEPAGRETRWQVQGGQAQPALQTYRVRYEIDVDAEDPLAAARQAYGYMLSPESYRPVLEVAAHLDAGEIDFSTAETFDLQEVGGRDDMARQLEQVADIIESTYPHDANGRRVEGDSPVSGADVVDRLAALEVPIREALRRYAGDGPR
jgi:hypothetical protein